MANKNQEPGTAGNTVPQLFSIEELQKKKKTPSSTFGGICAACGWKPGKMITQADYDSAVEKFSRSPIGKKVK